MGHESLIYFRPIHFMTPEKAVTALSMYFMGDESSNGPWNSHEGTIKNPWNCPTHTSTKVDINISEKCCAHNINS